MVNARPLGDGPAYRIVEGGSVSPTVELRQNALRAGQGFDDDPRGNKIVPGLGKLLDRKPRLLLFRSRAAGAAFQAVQHDTHAGVERPKKGQAELEVGDLSLQRFIALATPEG